MPVIILSNLKGGVAKTTSAVAIAECLAAQGRRTLLIDADHQCMAGELLLGETRQLQQEQRRRTLHDLLAAMLDGEFTPAQCPAFVTPGASNIGGGLEHLSVLPCSIRIDAFSENMAKARRGHRSNEEFLAAWATRTGQFRRWLTSTYEYTVVDCPPSMALQVQFLFRVADSYVIPCVPDRLSVRGSLYLTDRVAARGYRAAPLGTLWSLYRAQTAMHKRIVEMGAKRSAPLDRLPPPFKTTIPNATAIAEATEPGRPALTFRRKYGPEAAPLFEALCKEIVQRAEAQRLAEQAAAATGPARPTPAAPGGPAATGAPTPVPHPVRKAVPQPA